MACGRVPASSSGRARHRRPTAATVLCGSRRVRIALPEAGAGWPGHRHPAANPVSGPLLSDNSPMARRYHCADSPCERVALELARRLPSATVHTSFYDAERFGHRINPLRVRLWPLQRRFGPTRHFRSFLPLSPAGFCWFSRRPTSAPGPRTSTPPSFARRGESCWPGWAWTARSPWLPDDRAIVGSARDRRMARCATPSLVGESWA